MHVKIGSAKAAPAKSKTMAPNVGGRNQTINLGKSNISLKEEDASMAPNIQNQPAPETKDVPLVSCYRSGGAMPIPRQAAVKKFAKWKPKVKLNLQSYTEDQEDVTEEVVEEFKSDKVDMSEAVIEDVPDDDFHVAVVVVVNVLEEPLPPPKPKQQNCKKHSRCHCDMLSLDTTDFFTIQV